MPINIAFTDLNSDYHLKTILNKWQKGKILRCFAADWICLPEYPPITLHNPIFSELKHKELAEAKQAFKYDNNNIESFNRLKTLSSENIM